MNTGTPAICYHTELEDVSLEETILFSWYTINLNIRIRVPLPQRASRMMTSVKFVRSIQSEELTR